MDRGHGCTVADRPSGRRILQVEFGDAIMPGETSLQAGCHGNVQDCTIRSDEEKDEKRHMNVQFGVDLFLEPTDSLFSEWHCPSQLELNEGLHEWLPEGHWSQDGTPALEGCVQLERRWMLWHEFMKEHSRLDDWLRLAEKLAASPNSSHVLYVTAKEELKRFESLLTEARVRLTQLDSLTQRNRTLIRLFRGAMRTRLVAMTRDCGQRWDHLSRTVESVCRQLKHFVSQREDFDRQREEMAVWLADMDLRLTEVEHFSGKDTCAKMRQLQSFKEAVGENTVRLNRLLEQGEALIQRSEPADGQAIEAELQELLLYCAHVFEGLGRLHTRLLSMRLVFEEDWAFSPPPDSGCPSEALQEDEGTSDRNSTSDQQSCHAHPTQDHLVLEWDPSVDIGGSVCHDDADSSYYSSTTGMCHMEEPLFKDPWRRRAYLSCVDSPSDMTGAGAPDTSTENRSEGAAHSLTRAPDVSNGSPLHRAPWKTSTPDGHSAEPVTFDPERISAWLGLMHRHAPTVPLQTPCCKAVQTEHSQQCSSSSEEGGRYRNDVFSRRRPCPQHGIETGAAPHPALSHDSQPHSDWTGRRRHPDPQSLEEGTCCTDLQEAKVHMKPCSPCRPEASPSGWWGCKPWPLGPLRLTEVLKASALLSVLLALLTWLISAYSESECHRANTLARSFHLGLRYVNGPPPT